MFTEEFIVKLIANSAQAQDMESVNILTDALNEMRNPVEEKRTRAKSNTSGYVALDMDGKFVAKFDTVKAANEFVGKKPTASCISQACRNYQAGKSNVAYSYRWVYGSDYEA